MNKKMILGLLALSSMASYAVEHTGYVKTNNSLEVKSKDAQKVSDEHKVDAAAFIGETKDFAAFTGAKVTFASPSFEGYLGTRYDGKISDNTNLTVTASIRKGASPEAALIEQLKAKGLWNKDLEKNINKGDKISLFNKYGIRLDENILLSGLVKHNFGKTDLNYGIIYNADIKDGKHRIESLVGVKTNINDVKLEANVNHLIGKYDTLKVTNEASDKPFLSFDEVKTIYGFGTGGILKGDVSINTKIGEVDFTSKAKLTHYDVAGSYKESDKEHKFDASLENKAVYKKGDLTLEGNANYDVRFVQHKEDGYPNRQIHKKPTLKAKVSYENDAVKIAFNVKDAFKKQKLLSKVDTTPDLKYAKYSNLFFADGLFEGKAGDGLSLGLRFKALNHVDRNAPNPSTKDDTTVVTKFAASPVINYKKDNGKLKADNSLGAGYYLSNVSTTDKDNKKDPKFENGLIFYTLNDVKYKVNDNVTLEGAANFSGAFKFDKEKLQPMEVAGQLKFKPIYDNKEGVTLSTEIGALAFTKEFELDKIRFEGIVKPEIKYVANSTVTIGSNTEFKYSYRHAAETVKHTFLKHKELLFGDTDGVKHSKELAYSTDIKTFGEIEAEKSIADKIEKEGKSADTAEFSIKPTVWATFSLVENKLTVEPKLELTINTQHKITNGDKALKFDQVIGKGSLKVEYKW